MRREDVFPTLTPEQIERLIPLGRERVVAAGEPVWHEGHVVCRGQRALRKPKIDELARCLGLSQVRSTAVRDLVVVGAGPAGLASAVYDASEGLDVLVLESHAPGGQAGASSRADLARFEGVGVYYGATHLEANIAVASPLVVVGGGNSMDDRDSSRPGAISTKRICKPLNGRWHVLPCRSRRASRMCSPWATRAPIA